MADTPIWVQLLSPVIAAVATWGTTKFEVLSFTKLKLYEGTWYAYYRDPDDTRVVQEETWEFTPLGSVKVRRNGRVTFKGRLSLKGAKAYMNVDSVRTGDERLFVMLDPPANPRGLDRPSICLWLGKDGDGRITAGHGLMSRERVTNPDLKNVFLRASMVAKDAQKVSGRPTSTQ